MRKEELIKRVADSTGIAACEVREVIESAIKESMDAVAEGKTLYIRGFGTLSPKHYKKKVARNIAKNETITIAEHYTPHFKPAKSFKDRTKKL
jgi:DNA-binding protein HU-beta